MNPNNKMRRLGFVRRFAVLGGFALLCSAPTLATPVYVYNWTETVGKHVGLTGTADITLGAALAGGIYSISDFTIISNGGFCGVCTPLTQDLSLLFFDSNTLGVFGVDVGTYQGQGGGTHDYHLGSMDIPELGGTGEWAFFKDSLFDAAGTYTTTLKSVPEPAVLVLLVPGVLAGLWLARRRARLAH